MSRQEDQWEDTDRFNWRQECWPLGWVMSSGAKAKDGKPPTRIKED